MSKPKSKPDKYLPQLSKSSKENKNQPFSIDKIPTEEVK